MITLTVGQEVRVFDVNGKRNGMPEDGYPGRVVRVGRRLVTISQDAGDPGRVFRLEDGRANDSRGHQWFLTLPQVDEMLRYRAAKGILRARGVELSPAHSFTLDQVEALAGVAKKFGEQP